MLRPQQTLDRGLVLLVVVAGMLCLRLLLWLRLWLWLLLWLRLRLWGGGWWGVGRSSIKDGTSSLLCGKQSGVEWEWVSSVENLIVGVKNRISKVEQCKFYNLRGVLRGGLENES